MQWLQFIYYICLDPITQSRALLLLLFILLLLDYYRTVHEQGGCLVLSSCFNVLYFTKVNLILLVRVVGLLFMSYVTE